MTKEKEGKMLTIADILGILGFILALILGIIQIAEYVRSVDEDIAIDSWTDGGLRIGVYSDSLAELMDDGFASLQNDDLYFSYTVRLTVYNLSEYPIICFDEKLTDSEGNELYIAPDSPEADSYFQSVNSKRIESKDVLFRDLTTNLDDVITEEQKDYIREYAVDNFDRVYEEHGNHLATPMLYHPEYTYEESVSARLFQEAVSSYYESQNPSRLVPALNYELLTITRNNSYNSVHHTIEYSP